MVKKVVKKAARSAKAKTPKKAAKAGNTKRAPAKTASKAPARTKKGSGFIDELRSAAKASAAKRLIK